MSAKITRCSCKHTYQDEKFGDRNRVHVKCQRGWRCTVCQHEKGEGEEKKK